MSSKRCRAAEAATEEAPVETAAEEAPAAEDAAEEAPVVQITFIITVRYLLNNSSVIF